MKRPFSKCVLNMYSLSYYEVNSVLQLPVRRTETTLNETARVDPCSSSISFSSKNMIDLMPHWVCLYEFFWPTDLNILCNQ